MYKKITQFLEKKDIHILARIYFIDAMNAMAMGLFSSLLVGTILNTIGLKLHIPFLNETIWPLCKEMTGAAIGVAIAQALHAHSFVLVSASIAGYAGTSFGGVAGAFIASVVAVECGKRISRKTKIDLLATPITTILSGTFIAVLIGPSLSTLMTSIGKILMTAINLHPFFMSATISVLVGMVLTLPISSAALCMMISLSGLAGGAAAAGCCAQMIGFAVMSFKDNGWGGVLAVGIGTSMLQITNIIKNPRIWIPPTLTAAITGPISTMIFQLENTPIGSGMGTCGLVGQIGALTAMTEIGTSLLFSFSAIFAVHFFLPAILTLCFSTVMYKAGYIKKGDLTLEL